MTIQGVESEDLVTESGVTLCDRIPLKDGKKGEDLLVPVVTSPGSRVSEDYDRTANKEEKCRVRRLGVFFSFFCSVFVSKVHLVGWEAGIPFLSFFLLL